MPIPIPILFIIPYANGNMLVFLQHLCCWSTIAAVSPIFVIFWQNSGSLLSTPFQYCFDIVIPLYTYKVYIDNGDHNDGYTVVLEPPFDYTTLPNFNVYSSTNNVLNTNFRASVTDIPFDMMYAYYFYSDQNYNLRVKLLYNFPKFKKNSDGSMHTVKRFVANVYAKFASISGEEPKITYTCNITDTNSHIANCNLKNNNIVITKCKPGNSYCYVADNYEKGNAYYVLDNGDVISAKKASERNGVSHFVSSGGHISYEIRIHYTKFR